MRKRSIWLLAALATASGCQNAGYIMDTYNPVKKQIVQSDGGSYWVFDRPDLGKIMTTPSPGTIAAPALISGATVGLVNVDPVVQAHQQIALKYLASTGRHCSLKTSSEIWRPEYEHTYTCS